MFLYYHVQYKLNLVNFRFIQLVLIIFVLEAVGGGRVAAYGTIFAHANSFSAYGKGNREARLSD